MQMIPTKSKALWIGEELTKLLNTFQTEIVEKRSEKNETK